MTDPAPLTDDLCCPWYDGMIVCAHCAKSSWATATVEQARRERDAAQAPSVELVQALLESENVVDRLTAERDAAHAVIRWFDAGYEYVEAKNYDGFSDAWCHPIDGDLPVSPEAVDAIRRARATPEGTSDE